MDYPLISTRAPRNSLTESARRERQRQRVARFRAKKKQQQSTTINLFDQFTRWCDVKTRFGTDDDEEVAQMLLDLYDQWRISNLNSEFHHSTTSVEKVKKKQKVSGKTTTIGLPGNNTSDVEFDVSVQLCDGSRCSIDDLYGTSKDDRFMDDYVPDSIQVKLKNTSIDYDDLDVVRPVEDFEQIPDDVKSGDFVGSDHQNKTHDHVSETDDHVDIADFHMTLKHTDEVNDQANNAAEADDIYEDMKSYSELLKERLSIVYHCQLIALSKLSIPSKCKQCDGEVHIKSRHIGSCTVLNWICSSGHKIGRWSSQPVVREINMGDFMLATNILLSGNDFDKISLMFKFMNLGCVSESMFYRIQDHHCVPAINDFWERMVQSTLDSLQVQDLVLMGEGQSYSLDDNAQYPNYSVMEKSTGLVLHVNTVDGRECEQDSIKLEVLGLKRALSVLEENGQIVKELVTNSNEQITSFMEVEKPYIKHSLDMWHGVQKITKQISKSTLKEDNRKLVLWMKDVLSYFWWCCRYSKGDVTVIKKYWKELLHHVVNNTESITDENSIPESTESLLPESEPYLALKKIVIDELKSLPYYVNFRHTEEMESFLNNKLMYINERQAFSQHVSHARCLLAAIDFNWHLHREVVKDGDGNTR